MNTTNPVKCFVAMAFDQPDTERFYRTLLRPALRSCGVNPRRVIDVNHNDDIDNQIKAMLEEAEVMVADLTYARPSVYYEAGFAERKVPVIYTCRSDHFTARSDDPHGNLRIHFDLQMRNVVKWRSPEDATFPRRLASRVKKVIGPILRERSRRDQEREDVRTFERLPLLHRAAGIEKEAAVAFGGAGAQVWRDLDYRKLVNDLSGAPVGSRNRRLAGRFLRLFGAGMLFTATRLTGGTYVAWVVYVGTGSAAKQLAAAKEELFAYPVYELSAVSTAQSIREHILLCTTDRLSATSMERALPDAHTLDDSVLNWKAASVGIAATGRGSRMFVVPWYPMSTPEPFLLKWPDVVDQKTAQDAVFNVNVRVERHVFVHVVDRIKSLTDVAARLRAMRDSAASIAAQK